jgi:hypothetical protein
MVFPTKFPEKLKARSAAAASETVLKGYWLPTIKAAIELNANNSAQALVFLEAAAPYELGRPPQLQVGTLYPAYIRGEAQLLARNGSGAAAEFQKFLDHRGVVVNFPLGALARLGLAPATCSPATLRRLVPSIRTSSPCGKTPTLTFPSSSKPRRSTPSCSSLQVPRRSGA